MIDKRLGIRFGTKKGSETCLLWLNANKELIFITCASFSEERVNYMWTLFRSGEDDLFALDITEFGTYAQVEEYLKKTGHLQKLLMEERHD